MAEQYNLEQLKKDLEEAIVQADILKIFDYLLTIAVEEGASDIHIEPFENYSRIRIRIDGVLYELIQYPKQIHESIIAKFKIESWQMRPDEKRVPQDARVSAITLTGKEVDLRANTLPTVWGEKLVMRIVDKSKKIPPLNALGIEGSNEEILFRNLDSPTGIILTTGPTGSGKTTTLYSALSYLNKVEVNITTYEDPVENKMDWLNQSQIRSDIGYTFAAWLRAALRQDPDIIMVWEIRDWETLDTAMEAAMTWHLVFSTIHTNSAAETLTRVINLGAKPYMIAGTFNLVMAQRLARKICQECKEEYSLKEENPKVYKWIVEALSSMGPALATELQKRGIDPQRLKEGVFFRPKKDGCPESCGGKQFKGRIWIYEMMEYTDELKEQILKGSSWFEVEKFALAKGMINLERDAIFKALQGHIPPDEIYRLVKHKDYSAVIKMQW